MAVADLAAHPIAETVLAADLWALADRVRHPTAPLPDTRLRDTGRAALRAAADQAA